VSAAADGKPIRAVYSSVRDRPSTTADQAPPPGPPDGPGAPEQSGRIGRNVWYLGLTSMFTDISSEMVNAILPLYLLSLGFSPLAFGVFDGYYQGMTGLLRSVGGLIADRRGRHKEVAGAGYALSAACKLGLLASRTAGPTGAILLLDRTGKGIRTAPRDALVSMSSSKSRLAEAFGIHRALDTVGAFVGPILAFVLLRRVSNGYDVVFVFSFCFALIGLGILTFFVQNRAAARASAAAGQSPPSLRAAAGLLRIPRFRRLVVAGGALGLMTVSDAFIYLTFQRQSHMASSAFPLLFVGTALAYLLLAVPAGRLADRVGRAKVFLGGYLLLAGSYVALHQAGSGLTGLLVLLGLLGAYYAATDGVLMALASTAVPEELRGSGMALLTTVTAVARFAASLIFGLLWTWWGPETAVVWFLGGLAVALPLCGAALLRHPEVTA